jgi:hypothetical protein
MISNLRVENFGAVRKADITFGDLTVFTGQHNTGKTYLALLTHTLMRAVSLAIVNTAVNFVMSRNKFEHFKDEFKHVFKSVLKANLIEDFFVGKVSELINQKSKNSMIYFEWPNNLQVSTKITKNNQVRINKINLSNHFVEKNLEVINSVREDFHQAKFKVPLDKTVTEVIEELQLRFIEKLQSISVFIPTERLMIMTNFIPTVQLMAQDIKTMFLRREILQKTMKPAILDFITFSSA